MIYISSDHHFFDNNYLYHNNRYQLGKNIKTINKSLISQQNNQVNSTDEIYYIGDFSSAKIKDTIDLMNKLNGKIYLLIGNHDKFKKYNITINNKLTILDDTIYTLNYNNYIFNLFHYPLYEQPDYYKGAIHLHGHTHGKIKYNDMAIDVGYDNNNFRLLSINDIIKTYEYNK